MPLIIGNWELDNFYHKKHSAVMSLPKNLQDCYFFYYSVCRKGTSCPYRHEASALGHERVCPKWSEGQCFQSNCPERHMVIEKARNQIQCYWENKPNGCRKPHCVFKHMNSMPVSANTTVITAVNPNVVATALIHMQQQQQQQQQTHQTQLQTIHQQPNQVNNCLDQSLIDK